MKAIPEGYHSVQPYIILPNCVEAIAFYAKAFGARERLRIPGKDGKTVHAEIEIGDSCIMMSDGGPASEAYPPAHYGGSPVSLMFYTDDCDAMYRQAIAAGATSLREPADQPYGDRMAGVRDPFGYSWWLGTHIRDVSMEELGKLGQ